MKVLVSTHFAVEGKADLYEKFLQEHKTPFVRSLPGVKDYKICRAADCMVPPGKALRYEFAAIIELEEGADAQTIFASPEYQAFRQRYIDMLEPDPGLYWGYEIECKPRKSSDEIRSAA